MVEDNEIKTTISPFAIRSGEIKVFDGKDSYVSMTQIVKRVDLGHITDIHFKIIEIINKFEFITSRQLYLILKNKGISIKSQEKLNERLDQLTKTRILTRYFFRSEDGDCTYRVFCLEKMGKYLLESRDEECKWQQSDNTKPVSMIKKRLAGNQIILAYMRKVENFTDYNIKLAITAKQAGKVFKIMGAKIKLTKEEKDAYIVYEVIRREEEWEKKLIEKIKLYNDFYENFVPGDSGFEKLPQLILCCEDDKHVAETFKIIITKELENSRVKIYFTTDLRQNDEKLEKSLIGFKIDETTGKYKMEEIETKILS